MTRSPPPALHSGRPDGRTRLREATRADHERLHRQPAFAALADATLDLPAYRALLARLYGFHATLERLLGERIDADRADWADLRAPRAIWLWRDLRDLDVSEDELARLPLAEPGQLPDLVDEGRLVGCLYVRAGSTLGGRLMAKGLDPLLGPGGENGRRFLSGCGGADAQWRQCCAAIERATDAGRWDAMREGAAVTFTALESWMNGGA
ncbi:Heme oxygenase [Rhodoblastus acidophilus]|uniref:Heme oxygenase n=1 Tax=Rhodoblastus acidophilus TaxID=1074 RepID=A0A212S104_RHOAC|nr:Heme oxygenase [Rhodoblastus acidophilus]